MRPTGIVIFALTYLLISARRFRWLGFDRPAGALVGAVACVAFGVLSPTRALHAIDGATLLLLFGVMGMGAFLAIDGFFEAIEGRLVTLARTPTRLLGIIVWGSGIISAFITNDAVCVLGAPLVVRLIRSNRLTPLPFLLALCTAANTGSVATLVGNPQNMLCGILGQLSYVKHLSVMGPVALVGLALNHLFLVVLFRRELDTAALESRTAKPIPARAKLTLLVIAGSAVAYAAGANLAWTSVAGFSLLMLIQRRDTRGLWENIEWSLLLFFAGLFVVVEGLMESGLPAAVFARFPLAAFGTDLKGWLGLSGLFLVGSNVVSNVPFILVIREQMGTLADPELGWELLAMAATFAGNLTLLGSVANIIVAEQARDVGGIGFVAYLRVGVPIALATTLVGVLWTVLVW